MQISLFTCRCENERVDKTSYLFDRFPLDGTLRNDSSVIDPVILIEKTNPQKPIYNYLYIEEFRRYYFINDWVSVRNKVWELHAHVDVLFTWRENIKQCKAVIDKSESSGYANYYLDDGSFVMESRKFNEVLPFQSGLSQNGQFILICAGGSDSVQPIPPVEGGENNAG